MADVWQAFFVRDTLNQGEIDRKQISSGWAVLQGRQAFLDTLGDLPDSTYRREYSNVIVRCGQHSDENCKLVVRGNNENPQQCQYVVKLSDGFMDGADLRVRKRVEAYFKWNGDRLEIKIEQSPSPEADFQIYTELALLGMKEHVTRKDLKDRKLLLPQTNLRSFYDSCPPLVQQWLDEEKWFNIQLYPPGMFNSVGAEMRSKMGFLGVIEECSLLINISKIVANYKDSLNVHDPLTVKYKWLAGKLEVVFLTGNEPANLDHLLQGPLVHGA
jgi:hypothetical protein